METIISTLAGVIIGGLITYWFSLKQDKKTIKRELTLKASEELLDRINKFSITLSSLGGCIIDYIFHIQQYNQYLEKLNKKGYIPQPELNNVTVVCIEDNIVRMCSDNINKDIQSHFQRWEEFGSAFNSFWSTFESRQVVLNEFNNMYDFILTEFDNLLSAESNFMGNYHMKVFNKISIRNQVSEDLLNEASMLLEIYQKQIFHMQSYLGDFKIELQNNYLSKLFKYKISRRKPKDNSFVLTKDVKCEHEE